MGCAGSSIEALPVTDHESGLSIIDEISIKTIETTGLDLSLETGTYYLIHCGQKKIFGMV